MSTRIQRITPFLWFDDQAEEAAAFYAKIFPDSRIVSVVRYAASASGKSAGAVMTVAFQLDGQDFTALNGGPGVPANGPFPGAISLVVNCQSQREVDHYWQRLGEGGDPEARRCGWLKDRFGVSWQVVPTRLPELLADPDPVRGRRVMEAMLQMKKLDVTALERAAG